MMLASIVLPRPTSSARMARPPMSRSTRCATSIWCGSSLIALASSVISRSKPGTRAMRSASRRNSYQARLAGGSLSFSANDASLGRPLEQSLGVRVPGLGIVILALLVLLVGSAVQNAVGRRVVQAWNTALSRLPLTRRIYNAGSQIVQALLAGDRRVFSRAVLVPYPTDGSWAVGFVTNERTPILSQVVGEPCLP